MYQALKPSRSTFVPIRDHQYHVLQWGERQPDHPPLVLVHGWMDVAASWQFMVDALTQNRWIIAPDWRGFGQSRLIGADQANAASVDCYWFPDYLADLDALLDHFAGEGAAVDLVGHSMGGNIAMMYGGVRPERINRLVNLEGFGLPATRPAQAPERYAKWMDELKALRRGETALKDYDSVDGVARRLMKTNPRLGEDKATWLASHWAAPNAQGRWAILGEPAHKISNAHIYQVEETLATYRRISAPVLSITASDDSLSQWWKGQFTLAEYLERLIQVPQVESAVIQDAGHMMHHDQPQALAALLERFFTAR
ncbi:alpha/beta hydrolase [Hydrogenophaga crassostreae]|uniref:Alpha/beta hydrolase n=1 Tax=Hydrogenophaga crassostreae TaxID=1763535 RepID=A0A167ICV8_9BURK|nr:alpha/beta hydrolase [Hydrogenophaga crassostreae]AOW12362.1 alpha/beta hydrolase [Hydrogenophaga crassostreae]OAD42523.1 alpha/beta hydrolase [Hydrogenophaga crassostreae]